GAVPRQHVEADAHPSTSTRFLPLRPEGRRGRGPSRSDGRVRWDSSSALESPTSPRPSPPPGATRESLGRFSSINQNLIRRLRWRNVTRIEFSGENGGASRRRYLP